MEAIIEAKESDKRSIYNYLDIEGIRQYLVCHPKLLLMFEILVNHIDDYINYHTVTDKVMIHKSSHI